MTRDEAMALLAQSIADDLFTGGDGREASRLVLEVCRKLDGSGWGKQPVANLIERHLRASPISRPAPVDGAESECVALYNEALHLLSAGLSSPELDRMEEHFRAALSRALAASAAARDDKVRALVEAVDNVLDADEAESRHALSESLPALRAARAAMGPTT